MNSLHLHVKTIYFDAIKRGDKTEENRLVNSYWRKRMTTGDYVPKQFDSVIIYNAYKPGPENKIERSWRGWKIKTITHPHFGPEEVVVFAIAI